MSTRSTTERLTGMSILVSISERDHDHPNWYFSIAPNPTSMTFKPAQPSRLTSFWITKPDDADDIPVDSKHKADAKHIEIVGNQIIALRKRLIGMDDGNVDYNTEEEELASSIRDLIEDTRPERLLGTFKARRSTPESGKHSREAWAAMRASEEYLTILDND